MKNKKAFTFIEVMIIVTIIGLLASIILALWAVSAQNKAAINGYKTSMQSVRTAVEMCRISGGSIVTGAQAEADICNPGINSKYPSFSAKCGTAPYFCGSVDAQGLWHITNYSDAGCSSLWDCRGCRLDCSTEKCEGIGNCN